MKRSAKILSVVLTLVLVACALVAVFVFNASAANATYTRSGATTGYDYVHKENAGKTGTIQMTNTNDLQEAFANALESTTIYMNSDMEYEFATAKDYIQVGHRLKPEAGQAQGEVNTNNYGGPFVFDMGGHNLTFIQKGSSNNIRIASNRKLTFTNGTINVGVAGEEGTGGSAYPIVAFAWGNASFVLDNVNTRSAGIAYIPSDRGNENNYLSVKGGTHYVIANPGAGINTLDQEPFAMGAFIDTRANLVATVTGATFYIEEGNYLLNAASYSRNTTDGAESKFVFKNCTVLGEMATTELIKNLNSTMEVSFTNSTVYGSINPSIMAGDSAEGYTAATKGNVFFGYSVLYSSEATLVVTYDSDAEQISQNNTVTTPYLPKTFNGIGQADTQGLNGTYQITNTTRDITLNMCNYIDDQFEIIGSNGVSKGTLPYGTKIGDAIAQLTEGDTLKLLADVHALGELDANGGGKTYVAQIKTSITIDLNGYMWAVEQQKGNDGKIEQRVGVATSKPVTIKNGTLAARHNDSNVACCFFQSEGTVIDIRFENVDTYLSTLVFIWRGCGSKITIDGGVHQSVYNASGGPNGYIATNDNATVVSNNATFYISGEYTSGPALFSASHATANPSITKRKQIDFIYNNCDIIAATVPTDTNNYNNTNVTTDSMLMCASADTNVYFNGCRLFGRMNGTSVYNSSIDQAIDEGSIRFGHDTKFINSQLRTDGVVVPARGTADKNLVSMAAETYTYTFNKLDYADAIAHNWDMTEVTFELSYDMIADADEAFEILNTDGVSHKEYLNDVYTNGAVTDKYTFYEAVQYANGLGSNYTVKLLYDYTIDTENLEEGRFQDSNNAFYAEFKKGTIVDLSGFELRLIKGSQTFAASFGGAWGNAGQEKFDLATTEPVIFKNGTITTTDLRVTDRVFPIFFASVNKADLTLENVDTYTGSLFYSYSASAKITVNGGYHTTYRMPQGVNGYGWIVCRNSLDLTVNDAVYTTTSNLPIVDVNSANASIASSNNTVYDLKFNNTSILMSSVTTQIINRMNYKTTAYFNGCNLYGSFNPSITTITSFDSDFSGGKLRNRSIIMGIDEGREGATGRATVWTSAGSVNNALLFAQNGYGIMNASSSSSNTYPTYANKYTPHVSGWYTASTTFNASFDKSIAPGHEVNFFLYNSTDPVDTVWVVPGYEAPIPELELTDVNNGWYQLIYTPDKWSTTPISSAALAAGGNKFANEEASLVINEPMNFYPVCTFKPYLTAANYSIVLMSHFAIRLYVPANTPDGIIIDQINGAAPRETAIVGGTKYYYKQVSTPNATALTQNYTAKVVFTVPSVLDSNGQSIQLTQNFSKISILRYATTILNSTDEKLVEAQTLMVDLLRYSYSIQSYLGTTSGAEATAVHELYEAHKEKGTVIDETKYDAALSATNADYSAIAGANGGPVTQITFNVASDKPRIMFYFAKEAGVTAATFTVNEGWLYNTTNEKLTGVNWGSTTYTANLNWDMYYYTSVDGIIVRGSGSNASGYTVVYDFNEYTAEQIKAGDKSKVGKTLDKVDANATVGPLYSLRADNMPIYNVDKLLTVTFTTASGTYTGTYDIDSYYINVKSMYEAGEIDEATYTKVKDILFAVRAYSASAAAYRFGPAQDENGYVYWY